MNTPRVGKVIAFEGEELARQFSERIGNAAFSAGQRMDEALEFVWNSARKRVQHYVQEEPFNALLLAVGAGILLGWAFKKNDK